MLRKILSVKEVVSFIRDAIENANLNDIWVEGEISNFKEVLGIIYFDLKDEESLLRCVYFGKNKENLKNGMKVIVKGDIGVYEKKGYYQLYVKEIKSHGVGELFIKFLELKEKLRKEGLFDEKYKKETPKIPSKIAIITSPDGAVLHDILNIISRRFPTNILVAPVRVQGEGCEEEIINAINEINKRNDIDLIILARGGGSWEDLQAFNEEKVARAIFSSRIPIISAIGHETDFTISDFVADKRASTPSAAAEMAVPSREEILSMLDLFLKRIIKVVEERINLYKRIIDGIMKRKAFLHADELILGKADELNYKIEKIKSLSKIYIENMKNMINIRFEILNALSPYNILSRGYSICFRVRDNKVFNSVEDIEVGEEIRIVVKDGDAKCSVKEKKKSDLKKH
ncbi:MAG: exodeoxyribonuclease VII large subunit [Thermoplasmatales archaeon]|nr:exodeoxyribonuclease VII large subunit [Thermoplasmatales archaeon]